MFFNVKQQEKNRKQLNRTDDCYVKTRKIRKTSSKIMLDVIKQERKRIRSR